MKLSLLCTLLLPLSSSVDAAFSTIKMRVMYVEEGESSVLKNASVKCSRRKEDSFEADHNNLTDTKKTDSNGYVELTCDEPSTRNGRNKNPNITCKVTHDNKKVNAVYTDTKRYDQNNQDKTVTDFGIVHVYPDRVERGDPGTMNGCGPEAFPSWFSSSVNYISGMEDACNIHDLCYENCSENKQTCDEEFLAIGHSICNDQYSDSSVVLKSFCKLKVSLSYQLLQLFGDRFYDDARVKVGCDDASSSGKQKLPFSPFTTAGMNTQTLRATKSG